MRRVPGIAIAILLVFGEGVNAQTAEQLGDLAQKNICPPPLDRYSPINANEVCNPGLRETRACDSRHKLSSRKWQQCYDAITECRNAVRKENEQILSYNKLVTRCAFERASKQAETMKAAQAAAKPDQQGTSTSARIEAARRKAAKADEVNKANRENLRDAQRDYDQRQLAELEERRESIRLEMERYDNAMAEIRRRDAEERQRQQERRNSYDRARAEAAAARRAQEEADAWATFSGIMLGITSSVLSNGVNNRPGYSGGGSSGAPSGTGNLRCRPGESIQRCTMR
jgi:membrane protein involved in colicin uptake